MNKSKSLYHTLWVVVFFSIAYFIAAYIKPFHVDEFYSWVYVKRCTFVDLLLLKDTGIGHPPIFHLLLKVVQNSVPFFYPLNVRLLNFLIGILFVIILGKSFKKKNLPVLFVYGVCLSALTLDAFVFTRMWGLTLLISYLVVCQANRVVESRTNKNLIWLGFLACIGLLVDYSFVLLLPFIFIHLFSVGHFSRRNVLFLIGSIFLLWIAASFVFALSHGRGIYFGFYSIFYSLTRYIYTLGNVFFFFWFEELYVGAIGVFLVSLYVCARRHERSMSANICILSFLVMLITMNLFIKYNFISTRYGIVICVVYLISFFLGRRNIDFNVSLKQQRIVVSLIFAALIALFVNPFFHPNLFVPRYHIALFPLLLEYVIACRDRKIQKIIGGILIVSGILYVFSYGVSNRYSAPSATDKMPVVFADVSSFSNYYFYGPQETVENAVILDQSLFDHSARMCRMGTTRFDSSTFDKVWLVAQHYFIEQSSSKYAILNVYDHLSLLDSVLFKYLTPIYPYYFSLYELKIKK
jgi:hypothetical protein